MRKLIVSCILIIFLILASIGVSRSATIKPLTYKPNPRAVHILMHQTFIDGCMMSAYIIFYDHMKVPPDKLKSQSMHRICVILSQERLDRHKNIYQILDLQAPPKLPSLPPVDKNKLENSI